MNEQDYIKVKVHKDKEDDRWLVSSKTGYRKHFKTSMSWREFEPALHYGRELAMEYRCELIVEREDR